MLLVLLDNYFDGGGVRLVCVEDEDWRKKKEYLEIRLKGEVN